MQIFSNLVANDYKSHVVVNGMVTFWLISTSVGALQCPKFEQALHEKHYETDPNVETVKLVSPKFGVLVTLLKIIAFPHNLNPPKPSLYNGTPNIQNQLEIICNQFG